MIPDADSCTDVSTENARLRESLTLYRSLVAQLPLPIGIYHRSAADATPGFRLVEANAAAERILGTSGAAAVGARLDAHLPQKLAARLDEACTSALQSGEPILLDLPELSAQDSAAANMSQRAARVLPLPGDCVAITFDTRNDTRNDSCNIPRTPAAQPQPEASTAARTERDTLHAFFMAAPAGLALFDEHLNCALANDTARRVLESSSSITPPEGLADEAAAADGQAAETLARLAPLAKRVLVSGKPLHIEVNQPSPEQPGQQHTWQTALFPIVDANQPTRLGALFIDTTAQRQAQAALRNSEALAQTLLNASPDTVIMLDTSYTVLAMNEASLQHFSRKHVQPIGMHIADLLPRELARQRIAWIERVVRSRQPVRFEDSYDGQFFDNSIYPVFDAQGALIRLSISVRDITRRKQLEEELRESKLILQGVIDRMPAVIFVKDTARRYLLINHQYERLLGVPRGQVIGRTNEEIADYLMRNNLVDAERAVAIQQLVATWYQEDQRVLSSGQPYHVEETAPIDDELRTFHATKFPLYDAQKNISGIGGFSIDITRRVEAESMLRSSHAELELHIQQRTAELSRTNRALEAEIAERERAEQQLRESELRLRTLADFTYDWEYWIGPDGIFVYISPSCERITGYTPQEFLRNPALLTQIIHPEDYDKAEIHEHALQHQQQHLSLEFRIIARNGDIRWIGHICQPVYAPDGSYLGQRASNRDITERVQMEEALRHSRALLQSVLDYSPTAIYVKDTEGRFLLVNNLSATLMQFEADEIVGKTGAELYPDEVHQQTLHIWHETEQQVLSTRRVVEYEFLVMFDGQPLTYLTILFPIFGIDGDIYAIGGITTDITRRKQTEEALRQSEWRYRTISELVSDFVYVYQVNPDGSLTPELMTDFSTRIASLSAEEMMQDWLRFIHPDDVALVRRNHERMLANESVTSEFRILDSSGSVYWLQSQAQPEWDDRQQRVVRIYGAAHDVTERKRAEQALTAAYDSMADLNGHLSRSRDLMRTLFDGLDDGLVLLDGTGIVQTINRTLARWLHSLPEQLVGHHWLAICESVEPPFPGNVLLHTLHSQRAHRRRERATRSTGEVRILDMQTLPLFGPDQTVDLIVIHVIDVTERLEFEELAIQHEKYAASSTLVATVAHEVNSPLQAIQNFLYLANRASEEKRSTYLQLVSEEIDRISSIVSQLLDIYRTDHNKLQPVDINVLISRVLLLTGSMLARHHIHVDRQLDPDTPLILGRADQLTQVILNLVINAIDAMADGGSLRLHTGRLPDKGAADGAQTDARQVPPASDGVVVFEVSDTGSGMTREVQARIFDSFFTTKSHGTGLGLAISRKIVGQHNGSITVRSSPGEGSTFTITLPVYVQPPEQTPAQADTTSSA